MGYKEEISKYKNQIKIPNRPMKEETLNRLCIGRYVCDAMKYYIRSHPYLMPIEAATEFRLDMEDCNVNDINNSRQFYAICEDWAQDIIDKCLLGK